MKQTARMMRCLLSISLIMQLFSGIVGIKPVEARPSQLINQKYMSSNTVQSSYLTLQSEVSEEMESSSDTKPGPPEPPESFSETPVESLPESEETIEESSETSQPPESSSQEESSQESSDSSSSSVDKPSSSSDQPPVQQDETQSESNISQIAPGSLMIKPANILEPINIASTVKRLASNYYDVALISIKSGIWVGQQLLFPSGTLAAGKLSNQLISYFESLLNLIIQA